MTTKFRRTIGDSDCWSTLSTPVGTFAMAGDELELHFVHLPGTFEEGDLPAERRGDPAAVREARAQIEAYFEHRLTTFSLPVAPEGTEFQRLVWENLALIGYGETESYGELALRIGRPSACRAVGLANGRNPIPLVLPCHRVIGSDGSLTGYGGGLGLKQRLLEHERSHPAWAGTAGSPGTERVRRSA